MRKQIILSLLLIVSVVMINEAEEKKVVSDGSCSDCVRDCYICLTGKSMPLSYGGNLYAQEYEANGAIKSYIPYGRIVNYARSTASVMEQKLNECKLSYNICSERAGCK